MEYLKAKSSSCMLRPTLTFTVMTSRSILTTIEKMTCSLLASSPRNHRLNSETSQTISSMTLRCSFPPAPSLYIILFLKTGIKENVHLKPDYKCHCRLVIYNYFYTNIANINPDAPPHDSELIKALKKPPPPWIAWAVINAWLIYAPINQNAESESLFD